MASSSSATATMPDEELRRKLLDLGEEDGIPVTDSTRPILLARLRRLQQSNSTPGNRPRRSLLSFSSDESDSGTPGADPTPPAALQQRRSGRRSSSSRGSPSAGVQPRHPIRRSMTALEMMSQQRADTDPAVVFKSPAPPGFTSKRQSLPGRPRRSLGGRGGSGGTRSAPGSLDLLDSSDSDVSDSSISNIPEHRGVDEFPRSRRGTVVTPTKQQVRSGARATESGGVETSGKRRHPAAVQQQQQHNGHHETGVVDGGVSLVGGGGEAMSDGGGGPVPDAPNHSQCVSMVLVAVCVLFFAGVGLIYLGARHKELVPSSHYALESSRSDVHPDCLSSSSDECFQAALKLKSILRQIAGQVECGERILKDGRQMTLAEAKSHLRSFNEQSQGVLVSLDDVLHVFSKNSHWGIRLLGGDSLAVTFDPDSVWLVSVIPEMGTMCTLRKALQNTIYKVSLGLGVGLAIAVVLCLLYWFWDRSRRERQETFVLVEKILEVLQNHHCAYSTQASNLQPYVAIPHVRDMLIPPSDRKLKRRVWDEAVRFIQNNESRVRFETQNVEGEDFLVWRWMQPDNAHNNSKYGNSKTSRIWQGQAFETLDTGMNALPCSPTQCLKVRNMFDPDIECEDEWPTHIRDAILDKCSEAEIVHLRVDSLSKEGCVYIKCRSSETAGKVYKELHGWWFDGKLVTVKYLRLERYHERFPEASTCTKTLKPSGVANTVASVFAIPGLSGMRLRSSPAANTSNTTPSASSSRDDMTRT